jgi:putative transposase
MALGYYTAMADTLQVGKTRWAHYQIAYHFVWIPKYRRRILLGDVQKATKEAIEVCCQTHGFTLLALETDEDHVHCFVSAPPKDSPAKIVGLLKGYSSRVVRQRCPSLAKRTGKEQLWTSAYYVGTAGAVSSEVIKRYIMECHGK